MLYNKLEVSGDPNSETNRVGLNNNRTTIFAAKHILANTTETRLHQPFACSFFSG